jgi:hypothetical protein
MMASTNVAVGAELFIGLVGAVGTDLSLVTEQLTQELRRVNYTPELLRLSRLISACAKYRELEKKVEGFEDERINASMDAGDDLRRTAQRGDAVVLLAISEVQNVRERRQGDARKPLPRFAYIFNSLKHPAEVETLREVYGPAFFLISAYSPREDRIKRLCELIARSRKDYRPSKYKANANQLNERDEQEIGDDFGQNVRETFPRADIFVDASSPDALGSSTFCSASRGHTIQWPPADPQPRFKQFPIHVDLEIGHLAFLFDNAVRLGISSEGSAGKTPERAGEGKSG